jgi:hypothetical protein
MGWWEVPNGEGAIGDEAADAFGAALRSTEPRRPAQVVASLERVLNDRGAEVVDGWAGNVRLVPRGGRSATEERQEPDADLVTALSDGLGEIGRIYRDRWGRLPKVNEVVETAAFVLRTDTGSGEESFEGIASSEGHDEAD